MQSATIRQDANNHLVQGLHAFLAVKERDYSVEGGVLAQAALTIDPAGADNALDFTAVLYGAEGNDITIEYIDPSALTSPLSIVVNDKAISFYLETDGAGAIISTADDLKTALLADAAASALVTAADNGGDDGSGVLAAEAIANLAGGAGARLFEVTGRVLRAVIAYCSDDLVSAGAGTLEAGIVGDTALVIAQTLGTDLDDGLYWIDAAPANVELLPSMIGHPADADILEKIATGDVTAGKVTYYCFWYPLSEDGEVKAV